MKKTLTLIAFIFVAVNTLSAQQGYEIRFFLLDTVGKLENMLFPE